MEIGLIAADGTVSPFLRAVGPDHRRSELAGVVFDPSGSRMYFASMGAYPLLAVPDLLASERGPGAIYEVSGPFRLPPGGAAGFGPPAGEQRPRGPLAPRTRRVRALLDLNAPRRISSARLLRRGLLLSVRLREPAMVGFALRTAAVPRGAGDGSSTPRPSRTTLARRRRRLRRTAQLRLELGSGARGVVRRRRRLEAILIAVARTKAEEVHVVCRRVRIGPRG